MGVQAGPGTMRISATGSEACGGRRGFTLLETLLVLALMAVVTVWVMPNFLAARDTGALKQGRQLVSLFRLCAQQAQLSGVEMACSLDDQGYRFSQWNEQAGEWLALRQEPFVPYRLPQPGYSIRVNLTDGNALHGKALSGARTARLVFYPDGSVTLADILIADGNEQVHIRLRPGPGGIELLP